MLGDNLRSLRNQRKLTQQTVADFLKIKRVTYTQYELNKREPDNDTLQKLATFYAVTVDDLLGEPLPLISKEQKKPKDLAKILEQREDLMFNGVPLDDEAKKDILHVIEFELYRRAKDLNKRKKDS